MKKSNRAIERKLELRKETLRSLTKKQLLQVPGGYEDAFEGFTDSFFCTFACKGRNSKDTIPS